MSVPPFHRFFKPVLTVLLDGKVYTIQEMYETVINVMGLSSEQLALTTKSGAKTQARDRVNWTLTYLYQADM